MREFSFNVDEQMFSRGLRPDARVQASLFFFRTLKNLKPSPMGLFPPSAITNPVVTPTTSTIAWPLPKLLRGESNTIVARDNSGTQEFYSMDESAWTGSLIALNQADTPGSGFTPSSGLHWEMVDFETSYVLCNGESLIYKFPGNDSDKILGVNSVSATIGVKCKAIGKHKHQNRLFLGGLSGGFFTDSGGWFIDTIFSLWQIVMRNRPDTYTADDLIFGENYVMYSDYSGGDIKVPFITLLAMLELPNTATVTAFSQAVLSDIKDGKIGFVQVKTQGAVQAIRQLGNNLVCYCDDSVVILQPEGNYYVQARLLDIGIKSRTAVGGDEGEHVFVDSADNLWRVRESGVERLRYNEYMDDLVAANIVVSFDPLEREYTIADGLIGFILTENGMCETTRLPTTLNRLSSGLVGISTEVSQEDAFDVLWDMGDLGSRDVKTLKQMDVLTKDMISIQGRFLYKYSGDDLFHDTRLTSSNPSGVIFCPKITANDFQGQITGTWKNVYSKLERATVRYNATGRQFRRGAQGVRGREQEAR